MPDRCTWCGDDPIYVTYHDTEWGVPVRDSKALWAKLILDGAQAGLSWITILRKRDNYYAAFDGLDPEKIVHYNDDKVAELLHNPGIVRNKLKINSAIKNARGYMQITEEYGSFGKFCWDFVDGQPLQNSWATMAEVPAETPLSQTVSKALKKQGFSFVGPTIVYAWMQAVGMINDHTTDCFRHVECQKLAEL